MKVGESVVVDPASFNPEYALSSVVHITNPKLWKTVTGLMHVPSECLSKAPEISSVPFMRCETKGDALLAAEAYYGYKGVDFGFLEVMFNNQEVKYTKGNKNERWRRDFSCHDTLWPARVLGGRG